jgi:AcrR family transcriptional regulator
MKNAQRQLPKSSLAERTNDLLKNKTSKTIIEVATDHFVKFGYRKASIAEIALASGVGKGSIYLHFENKEDLLISCIFSEKLTLLEKLKEIDKHQEPDQLFNYLQIVLNYSLKAPLSKALLSRHSEFVSFVKNVPDNVKYEQEIFSEYLKEQLIQPLNPNLDNDQLNAIKAALDMIILAVAHLPDLAFTSPNQELLETETIDTLALLLCQGITNNK